MTAMRLSSPLRKASRQAEPLLPMIDVVFFLIVFFMIVSRFAAPEPFPVALPQSAAQDLQPGEATIHLSAEGLVAAMDISGPVQGAAAVAALARRCGHGSCGPVLIHADAAAPASAVATLLRQLAAAGLPDLRLVTVQP